MYSLNKDKKIIVGLPKDEFYDIVFNELSEVVNRILFKLNDEFDKVDIETLYTETEESLQKHPFIKYNIYYERLLNSFIYKPISRTKKGKVSELLMFLIKNNVNNLIVRGVIK